MADVLAGIRLVSSANTAGIRQFTQSLGVFNLEVDNTGQFVDQLKTRVGAAFIGLGLAIEAGLGFAAAQAIEFENVMQRFAVISRLTASGVEEVHDRLLTLATQMNVSAESLGKLAIASGRLGLDAAGVERFTLAAAKLSVASGGALTGEEAVERISRIAHIFKTDLASSADKIASTFVGLARATNATESEISAIVTRTAEFGKFIGLTIPQMAALAATAKDLGLEPRRAAGAMEGLFKSITEHPRRFARQLHITGYEFRQLLQNDPIQIINKLGGAFKGLNQVQIIRRLGKMGITDAAQITLVLGLSKGIDMLSKNLKIAQEEFNKGTAANDAYQTLLGSTKMTLDVFLNGIHAVAIAFGEILLPPLKMVLSVGVMFMQFLLAIPKPIKVLMVVLAAATGALLILIGTFLLAITVAGVAKFAWIAAAGSLWRMELAALGASGMLFKYILSSLEAIAASLMHIPVLGGLSAAFYAVAEAALGAAAAESTFAAGFMAFMKVIGAAAQAIFGMAAGPLAVLAVGFVMWGVAMAALKPSLLFLWDSVKLLLVPFQTLADGAREIAAMFGTSGGGLGSVLMLFVKIALFPVISNILAIAFVFRVLASLITGVARVFIALVKPIVAPFAALYRWATDALSAVGAFFSSLVGEGTSAVTVFESIADAAGFLFTYFTPFGLMLRVVGAAFEFLGFVATSVFDGLADGFSEFTDLAGAFGLISESVQAVEDAFASLLEPFRLIISEWGIFSGAGDGFLKTVGAAIKTIVSYAIQPLIWYLRLVIGVWLGVIRIFLFGIRTLIDAFSWLLTPVVAVFSFISGLVVGFFSFMADQFSSFGSALKFIVIAMFLPFVLGFYLVYKGWGLLVDGFMAGVHAIGAAVDFLSAPFRSFFGMVSDVVDGIIGVIMAIPDAFRSAFNAVASVFSSFGKTAINVLIDQANNLVGGLNVFLPASMEIPQIPRLAEGGVAFKPTIAQIGEKGTEVVAPLSRLPQIAAAFAQDRPRDARQASGGSRGGGGQAVNITIPVTVMLDGAEMGRVVVKVTEEQIRRNYGNLNLRFSGIGG